MAGVDKCAFCLEMLLSSWYFPACFDPGATACCTSRQARKHEASAGWCELNCRLAAAELPHDVTSRASCIKTPHNSTAVWNFMARVPAQAPLW